MIKIMKYGEVPNSEIFARVSPSVNVSAIVADIIANVQKNGDKAVLEYNRKFDKAQLETLAVSPEEIQEAAFVLSCCLLKAQFPSFPKETTLTKALKTKDFGAFRMCCKFY